MKKLLLIFIILSTNLTFSQNIQFSDLQFKAHLLSANWNNVIAKDVNGNYIDIDQNFDNEISIAEANNIAELQLSGSNITSLDGIQYFSNLRKFSCPFSSIENTFFSGLQELEELDLRFNEISEIALDNLPNLKVLDLSGNYLLGTFSGYQLPLLETLDVGGCQLSVLDVEGLPSLKYLYSAVNQHNTINFPNENQIKYLFLDGSLITQIETSLLPELDSINVNDSYLEKLDFENHLNIKKIEANSLNNTENTQGDFFNIQGCSSLEYFAAEQNININQINFLGLNNLKYIYLSDTYINQLDLSNLANLQVVFATGLSEIDFSESNNLEKVEITSSDLFQINLANKPNLKYLMVISNNLQEVDLFNSPDLEFLDLTASKIAHLDLREQIALKHFKGNYGDFNTIDFSNLSELEFVELYNNPNLTALQLKNCTSLQLLETLLCSSLDEIDLSCSPNIQSMSLDDNLHFLNLRNGSDNSEILQINNWANFENLVVGVDFNEFFTQFGSDVLQTPYLDLASPCSFNSVYGKVNFSLDGENCLSENLAKGIKIRLEAEDVSYETFTDEEGFYVFHTGFDNIELRIIDENDNWISNNTTPTIINFNAENENVVQDFCLISDDEVEDLSVSIIPLTQLNPGFEANYKIFYKNTGTVVQSGKVKLEYDSQFLELLSTLPESDNSNSNIIEWDFENLLPFESREIIINFISNSPQDSPPLNIDDVIMFKSTIENSGQNTFIDEFILNHTVTGSYDPNDKTCLEGELIGESSIGGFLHYLIRFENTGTANARNVVVRDIINPEYFNISTLQLIDSSHNCQVLIDGNNNSVEFIFNDIHLPFPPSDLRHGYVLFKVEINEDLQIGEHVSNFADIFFDYNYPITTNEYVTSIQVLNVDDYNHNEKLIIYPNPTSHKLHLKLGNSKIEKIEICNMIGQVFTPIKSELNNVLDVSGLPKGIYFLKIHSDNHELFQSTFIKK